MWGPTDHEPVPLDSGSPRSLYGGGQLMVKGIESSRPSCGGNPSSVHDFPPPCYVPDMCENVSVYVCMNVYV